MSIDEAFEINLALQPVKRRLASIEGKQIWTIRGVRTINGLKPDDLGNIDVTAGGGVSDHSLLTNLDYAHAGHTGFQPAGSYLTATDLTPYSTKVQADLLYLGILAQAADSALLQGHNAAYFQPAGSYLTAEVDTLATVTARENIATGDIILKKGQKLIFDG